MTRTDAQVAREWAERALETEFSLDYVPTEGYQSAARYILDTTTPPTMADIAWDDEAHHLMEATAAWSDGNPSTVIMLNKFGKKIVVYQPSSHYSRVRELNPGILTPTGRKYRLDLAPLSEPAEDTPEPEQPRPEDVPEGELWIVEFDGQQCAAERELPGTEKPWWLMVGWRVSDEDVTLVSRLVPEQAPTHPEFLETEEDYENAPEGTVVVAFSNHPWMKVGGFWGRNGVKYYAAELCGVPREVLRWGQE